MFQNKYNVALNLMQKNEKNLKNVELLWTSGNLNKLKSAKPEQRDERLNENSRYVVCIDVFQ